MNKKQMSQVIERCTQNRSVDKQSNYIPTSWFYTYRCIFNVKLHLWFAIYGKNKHKHVFWHKNGDIAQWEPWFQV